jgi:hypothetical protein
VVAYDTRHIGVPGATGAPGVLKDVVGTRSVPAWCEEYDVFNLRMALECNDGVFPLHLTRVEDGVVYFRLQDATVQLRRGRQESGMAGQEEGQPAATLPLSPGADAGAEALPPLEVRASAAAEAPGGPEGEGVEPPRSPRKKATRATR